MTERFSMKGYYKRAYVRHIERIRELEAELAFYREPVPGLERTWRSRAEKAEAEVEWLRKMADCPHWCEICGGHLRKDGERESGRLTDGESVSSSEQVGAVGSRTAAANPAAGGGRESGKGQTPGKANEPGGESQAAADPAAHYWPACGHRPHAGTCYEPPAARCDACWEGRSHTHAARKEASP